MQTLFTMDKVLDKLPTKNRQNWYWEARFLQKYIKPHSRVLQIGSCDGIRLDYLARRRKDVQFVGLEIDRFLSGEANRRFKKYHGRVKSVCGDARDIPFGQNTFDYGICLNNTLGYIPVNRKVISELKRVIRKSGEVIVSVYGTKWTNHIVRRYFKTLGGQNIKIVGDNFSIDGITIKRYSKRDLIGLLGRGATIIRSIIGFVGICRK